MWVAADVVAFFQRGCWDSSPVALLANPNKERGGPWSNIEKEPVLGHEEFIIIFS